MPGRVPLDLEEVEAWPAKVWNIQPLLGTQGLALAVLSKPLNL